MFLSLLNEGFISNAPIFDIKDCLISFFKMWIIAVATPSQAFRITLPSNPSQTKTSTSPLKISLPSAFPTKLEFVS